MRDMCQVALIGRLTKDPELRSTAGGTAVCSMRVAYSTSRKNAEGGWEDKSNFIDVSVFGNQADACAQYLGKGKQVGVSGRLEWREWDASDGSGKRQSYEIVADLVQFLGGPPEAGAQQQESQPGEYSPQAATAAVDDDIPF
jgi:single-strand DNA-binding protein